MVSACRRFIPRAWGEQNALVGFVFRFIPRAWEHQTANTKPRTVFIPTGVGNRGTGSQTSPPSPVHPGRGGEPPRLRLGGPAPVHPHGRGGGPASVSPVGHGGSSHGRGERGIATCGSVVRFHRGSRRVRGAGGSSRAWERPWKLLVVFVRSGGFIPGVGTRRHAQQNFHPRPEDLKRWLFIPTGVGTPT